MIGWIALGMTAVVLVLIAWRVDDWSRDWTQNHAKLDRSHHDPAMHPLELQLSVDDAIDHFRSWADAQDHWKIDKVEHYEDGAEVHLTRTTGLFRFVDDIHVTISNANDGIRIDAESQSRVGKGDLGQNPRNLKELVRSIAGRI